MSKGIYTYKDKKLYKLVQDATIPTVITSVPTLTNATVHLDEPLRKVKEKITLSTMEVSNIRSNREMFMQLKEYIANENIISYEAIYPRYKAELEYSIIQDCKVIAHNKTICNLEATDAAVLLGVNNQNECIYRRVKRVRDTMEIAFNNVTPIGIMKSNTSCCKLVINDLTIYQDMSPYSGDVHNSIYCTPYGRGCNCTINDSLDDYAEIFSLNAQGIAIQDLNLTFIPLKILLELNITLADMVVVYDDTVIEELLEEQREILAAKDPSISNNPDAYYTYYQRCNSTTPNALMVVQNTLEEPFFDKTKMVHKDDVIKDIPDIELGEFVLYVETIDQQSTDTEDPDYNRHHHKGHHGKHHHHRSSVDIYHHFDKPPRKDDYGVVLVDEDGNVINPSPHDHNNDDSDDDNSGEDNPNTGGNNDDSGDDSGNDSGNDNPNTDGNNDDSGDDSGNDDNNNNNDNDDEDTDPDDDFNNSDGEFFDEDEDLLYLDVGKLNS